MNQISNFFEKFKNLIATDAAKKNAVAQAVLKIVGAKIDLDTITIRKYVAEVSYSPIMRTEILMHKAEILEEIRRIMPNAKITDIR